MDDLEPARVLEDLHAAVEEAQVQGDATGPEVPDRQLRQPVGQRWVEVQARALRVTRGVDAAQDGDQAEDRARSPRLGDVRLEVLDGEAALLSWQAGEQLGQRPVGLGDRVAGVLPALVAARTSSASRFATAAGWGLLALLVVSCVLWPLATDPDRTERSLRDIVALALRLTLAYPVRFLALGLVIAAIVVISTVAFVAILSVSIGFVALMVTRFVLPAADRLEARLATRGGLVDPAIGDTP